MGKYTYLCRMNYLVSQYRIFRALEPMFRDLNMAGNINGANVICSKLNNRAYLAKCECIVCLECRNA